MIEMVAFIILAFMLGFKHSYDADHVISVSNLLSKSESVKSSMKIGISWAIGHIVTAAAITFLLYTFHESVLNIALPYFEKAVGSMLIILGLLSLRRILRFHSHKHRHGSLIHSHPHIHSKHANMENHTHKHVFGIGIIQGLASNDELLVLFTASFGVTTLGSLMLGISFFSIGIMAGMALFCTLFSYPLIKMSSQKVQKFAYAGAGSASIIYGAYLLSALV